MVAESPKPGKMPQMGKPHVADRAGSLPESATVRIADHATRLRAEGKSVVDLSAGRACEATDPLICAAAKTALDEGHTHQTPARGLKAFREAVAAKLDRDNGLERNPYTEIMATLGCKNGLVLSLMALIDPGDEVLIEDPCFVSYAPTVTLCGGTPVRVSISQEDAWRFDPARLEASITPKTRVLILCSPGNPTGTVHTLGDLGVIAEIASRHDLFVVCDEIYEAVSWGGRRHLPLASLPGMSERVVGLMGFTKSYSMGGWRIGYAYGPASVIERMVMVQQHFMTCASSIGQIAGITALSDELTQSLSRTLWRDWEKRCEYFSRAFDTIDGIRAGMPEGGFYIWADISETGLDSESFAMRLLDAQCVAVVPGASFGSHTDNYVRATAVRSWDELEDGAERLRRFVDELRES